MAPRWLDRRDRPAPVYLHIGGPSTGTTYLQRLMAANSEVLAQNGFLLPGRSWRDVVLATHDALSYARDLSRDEADRFVSMYVNEWTLDYGASGREAVRTLLLRGYEAGVIPHKVEVEFVG